MTLSVDMCASCTTLGNLQPWTGSSVLPLSPIGTFIGVGVGVGMFFLFVVLTSVVVIILVVAVVKRKAVYKLKSDTLLGDNS